MVLRLTRYNPPDVSSERSTTVAAVDDLDALIRMERTAATFSDDIRLKLACRAQGTYPQFRLYDIIQVLIYTQPDVLPVCKHHV